MTKRRRPAERPGYPAPGQRGGCYGCVMGCQTLITGVLLLIGLVIFI